MSSATLRNCQVWLALCLAAVAASGCHCVTKASHAIPAARLDPHLFGDVREAQVPILLSALGQEKPKAHLIGAGDSLSVFIYGIFPPSVEETPVLQQFQTLNQRYYPPHGSIVGPSTGLPVRVNDDGTLELPLVGAIPVEGLTIQELTEKIKTLYRDNLGQLQPGRERVSVSLITPRTKRIVILRQDSAAEAAVITSPGNVDQIHRGSAQVIDLPAYENDVLHALGSSGGLPGTDAEREVWVMRNCAIHDQNRINQDSLDAMIARYRGGADCGPSVIRIPLFLYPNDPLPFGPKDVVLDDGDVVFVPRRNEYFYTGGLLRGGKIPMPADEDLDVLEAIALAQGSTAGPLAQSGAALAGGSPGHIVKPSRVLILRKLPDGSQIAIRVDLARALEDEKERILIRPDDLVMLNFKPTEAVENSVLNFFGGTVIFSPLQN